MSNVVPAEGIYLKQVWRYSPVVIMLNILMIGRLIKQYLNNKESNQSDSEHAKEDKGEEQEAEEAETDSRIAKLKKWKCFGPLYIVIVFIAVVLALFAANYITVWGTLNTIQSHAMTLGTLHGPFTIIASLTFCKPVTKHEIFGTVFIICAAILIIMDPEAKRVGDKDPNIITDLVCLLASISLALVFQFTELLS